MPGIFSMLKIKVKKVAKLAPFLALFYILNTLLLDAFTPW
jgi:hypothetical protein